MIGETRLAAGVRLEIAHEAEGLVFVQLAQLRDTQRGQRQRPKAPETFCRCRLPRTAAGLWASAVEVKLLLGLDHF